MMQVNVQMSKLGDFDLDFSLLIHSYSSLKIKPLVSQITQISQFLYQFWKLSCHKTDLQLFWLLHYGFYL